MLPIDSPSVSSPFSTRSTIESSPEAVGGQNSDPRSTGHGMEASAGVMQALLGGVNGLVFCQVESYTADRHV